MSLPNLAKPRPIIPPNAAHGEGTVVRAAAGTATAAIIIVSSPEEIRLRQETADDRRPNRSSDRNRIRPRCQKLMQHPEQRRSPIQLLWLNNQNQREIPANINEATAVAGNREVQAIKLQRLRNDGCSSVRIVAVYEINERILWQSNMKR